MSDMAIPDSQSLMRPLLTLASDRKEHSLTQAGAILGKQLGLNERELKALSSKGMPIFANHVAWAKVHLQAAELLDSPKKGYVKISDRGLKTLKEGPKNITIKYLNQFPEYAVNLGRTKKKARESHRLDKEESRSTKIQLDSSFTWIPIYTELAKKILLYRNRQVELLTAIRAIETLGFPVIATTEPGPQQTRIPLTEIDPFTFFACFNRALKEENRLGILTHIKEKLELHSGIPTDFDGIPVVDNRRAWFFPYAHKRKPDDVPSLWALAKAVVSGPPNKLEAQLFSRCLEIDTVGPAKLTMGMFWLNPHNYIAWDANNRRLFELNGINAEVVDFSTYLDLIRNVDAGLGTNYPQISRTAFDAVEPEKHLIDSIFNPKEEIGESQGKASALNLVLYGPPGTGKTYKSIERAVKIIEPSFTGSGHSAHRRRFHELARQGRIGFITFHQSYSYEDFVEGIRPVVDSDEEGDVPRYECRAGILKQLAVDALFDCLEPIELAKQLAPFDVVWRALLSEIESEPDAKYPGLTEKTSYELSVTPRGNIEGHNVISNKNFLCSRKVLAEVFDAKRSQDSVTASEVVEVVERGCHSHLVAVVFRELRRIEKSDFQSNGKQLQEIIYTHEERAGIVQRFLAEGEKSSHQLKPESEWNQYVLVIDEINRGNISKILGELITLIEPDKRLGQRDHQDGLTVTLPYSGNKFAVPANLWLLATMNTADKSIALVDLALRRRFEFEELHVDLAVCEKLTDQMRLALRELNRRITLRKDRDHQIGHAYFVGVADEAGFNRQFRKQIIPLLQEYFYNDWEGLRFVLGDSVGGFIRKIDGSDVPEARTKCQWFFDENGDALNCLKTLCNNYTVL